MLWRAHWLSEANPTQAGQRLEAAELSVNRSLMLAGQGAHQEVSHCPASGTW